MDLLHSHLHLLHCILLIFIIKNGVLTKTLLCFIHFIYISYPYDILDSKIARY